MVSWKLSKFSSNTDTLFLESFWFTEIFHMFSFQDIFKVVISPVLLYFLSFHTWTNNFNSVF